MINGTSNVEETALVLSASYALGGGLTAWIEYLDLEQEVSTPYYNFVATGNAISAEDRTPVFGGPLTADDSEFGSTTINTTDDDSLIIIGISLGF